MKILFEIAKFCLLVAAVGGMFYAYQYSMSQGIKTVIASQPPAPKLMDTPSFTFQDCDLIPVYGRPAKPCNFDTSPPVIKAAPIQTMSKADAQKAGLWFLLSTFSLPLALGGAALLGYYLVRGG